MFTNPSEPIRVYTDGSFQQKGHRAAWGWITTTPTSSFATARVVSVEHRNNRDYSQRMEAAAVLNALAEFAPLGRPIHIFTDCQSLCSLVERYQAGELPASYFLEQSPLFELGDALRFVELLNSLPVTLTWVRSHNRSFPNMVVDQMLRRVNLEGESEVAGVDFAVAALRSGRAIIWHKERAGDSYRSAYVEVFADNKIAA